MSSFLVPGSNSKEPHPKTCKVFSIYIWAQIASLGLFGSMPQSAICASAFVLHM